MSAKGYDKRRKRRLQREAKARRWEPLEDITDSMPDEYMERNAKPVRVLANNRYQVLVYHVRTPLFEEPMRWLSIKLRTREPMHDWRELQAIKNEVCGPEAEAVELYPAESRMVDTANQYHLWVLPDGMSFPFGYAERLVMEKPGGAAVQRPFDPALRPNDLTTMEDLGPIAGFGGVVAEDVE